MLIALRVLAGVAAAMIMPVTLSVITTSFPRRTSQSHRHLGRVRRRRRHHRAVRLRRDHRQRHLALGVRAPVASPPSPSPSPLFVRPHSVEHVEAGFDIAGSLLSVARCRRARARVPGRPRTRAGRPDHPRGFVAGLAATVAFVARRAPPRPPAARRAMFANRGLAAGSVNLFVVFA
jgi:hypothetical protein